MPWGKEEMEVDLEMDYKRLISMIEKLQNENKQVKEQTSTLKVAKESVDHIAESSRLTELCACWGNRNGHGGINAHRRTQGKNALRICFP